MLPKEIDTHIINCPYFGGKESIDRRIINGELTHIGHCKLEFHYRKICPSEKCVCATLFGLKQ